MQRGKISFGKINLNLSKPPAAGENESEQQQAGPSDGGAVGGFKKIDKNQMLKQIEDVTEDLEAQRLKEVMGLTGFGRKTAKVFDINVSFDLYVIPNPVNINDYLL